MNPGRTATRKADFGSYRFAKAGGRGPGSPPGARLPKTVGLAKRVGMSMGVEAALFRGFRYLPQVVESWRGGRLGTVPARAAINRQWV